MRFLRDRYICSIARVGDLDPLSTQLDLKTHISNILMMPSLDAYLFRIIPRGIWNKRVIGWRHHINVRYKRRVSFLNISTLWSYRTDLLFFDYFGSLVWKDQVLISFGKTKHAASFGDIMVMPDSKDLWAKTTSLAALSNSVNGLCETIGIFLNRQVLSAGRVQYMFRQILKIYSDKNGK